MLKLNKIEKNFNPRLSVPNYKAYLNNSIKKATNAKRYLHGIYDLKYGKSNLQTMDVFFKKKGSKSPIHIFIHGGYWRGLDKSYHTHMAVPFVDKNITFFNINYDLCPKVKLSDIKSQIIKAILWINKNSKTFNADNRNIVISGHSAGAHLASLMLSVDWRKYGIDKSIFKGLALISGIFNTEAVVKLKVNKEIGLSNYEAKLNNPLKLIPKVIVPLVISYGDKEPILWKKQSKDLISYLKKYDYICKEVICKNDNHFSLIDTLANINKKIVKDIIMLSYENDAKFFI